MNGPALQAIIGCMDVHVIRQCLIVVQGCQKKERNVLIGRQRCCRKSGTGRSSMFCYLLGKEPALVVGSWRLCIDCCAGVAKIHIFRHAKYIASDVGGLLFAHWICTGGTGCARVEQWYPGSESCLGEHERDTELCSASCEFSVTLQN